MVCNSCGNENPSITRTAKTENLDKLCSTIIAGFKAKYKDLIKKITDQTLLYKISTSNIDKDALKISIHYNGGDHNVIFYCLKETKLTVTLKVEIPSLDKSFVLKQSAVTCPNKLDEINSLNSLNSIIKHLNLVNIIYSKSEELKEEKLEEEEITVRDGEEISLKCLINWIITEYLEPDLHSHLIKKGVVKKTINEAILIQMLKDLLSALDICHKNNIVYGFINQEKIMERKNVSNSSKFDFVLINSNHSIQVNKNETETSGLEFMVSKNKSLLSGIPDHSLKLTKPSDIWLFGIMCFELVFGETLKESYEPCSLFKNHGFDESEDLFFEHVNSFIVLKIKTRKFSKKIKKFFKRCLTIKEEKRATVEELLEIIS